MEFRIQDPDHMNLLGLAIAKVLQAGDLLFFNTLGARHSHVGVYVGEGRFVHATNPRTGVRMDSLRQPYYAQRFEGAHSLLNP